MKDKIIPEDQYIEIKIDPMMEQPEWYWFERIDPKDWDIIIEFLGDFFGAPQIMEEKEE